MIKKKITESQTPNILFLFMTSSTMGITSYENLLNLYCANGDVTVRTWMLDLRVKQAIMKSRIGMMLYSKDGQLPILKAATKAPTNIRKMVPGPRIVPAINIVCNNKYLSTFTFTTWCLSLQISHCSLPQIVSHGPIGLLLSVLPLLPFLLSYNTCNILQMNLKQVVTLPGKRCKEVKCCHSLWWSSCSPAADPWC